MKRTLIKLGFFSLTIGLLAISIIFKKNLSPGIVINEVSFQNNDGNDWIELYNPGLNTKNLRGMYLTDDDKNKTKFRIQEDIAISPKGFQVIGGNNTDKDQVTLKTNFGLKNGETIYLISENGSEIIDSFSLILENDQSQKTIGRFPDGSTEMFTFSIPTKGEKNDKDEI